MLAPGALFANDFCIERLLGQGGMGEVYVATQLSTGRRRALKLMHATFVQDERLRQRFSQEARVGSHIASEHVVEVIGAGVDAASGQPWIAMELLEGEDMASVLSRRSVLTTAEVAEVFGQLCHALGAAHTAGIVHRDLKPENIFLATSQTRDAHRTVKVLDFGIAKLLADARATGGNDTGPIGTPLWMAPEQAQAGAAISPACDV
jgi:serine/threonine protein kinase